MTNEELATAMRWLLDEIAAAWAWADAAEAVYANDWADLLADDD